MASRRDAVPAALLRVLDSARTAGLDEERTSDLAVAVSEALSNAAIHGNKLRPDLEVAVKVSVSPRRLVVEVADAGPGFDRSAVGDPTHPARLLATGGRGLFLMQRLADRLEYNRAGNRVRLFVNRRSRPRRRSAD